jgi:hypothetical protein
MEGEKKVLLSYNDLFSPGQLRSALQTNPLPKDIGKFGLSRKLHQHQQPMYGIRVH